MPTPAPAADEISVPGLAAPVEVLRDAWGVPHIRAASLDDAFFANGYVHAQDRLWQMDAARRRAVGRFAEWGGPAAAPLDILSRRLDVEGVSRRDHAALSPAGAAMTARYAEGVNAFIAQGDLPLEYALLDAAPEPWEPWQCVAVMRQRGLMMGSVWFKLWRAAALRAAGPEAVPLLRYDDGGIERFVVPQGRQAERWLASLADLKPALDAMAEMAAPDATVAGSNNWAIDGRHTASGKPMVAGDPHRAFEIPGMYTQMHLTCPEFDAIGFSVPGVPAFPHFGHTERVAWCVTHAFADIHDLYVERFDPADPTLCATPDGYAKVSTREEVVKVRGASDRIVRVTVTRHGPLIVGEPEDGHAIALRSIQTEEGDRSLDCLLPMLRAPDLPKFYEATRGWGVIDHNLVGADVDGRVGVSIRAVIAERDRLNGWLPVPGWTADHDWRGLVPFERMPRVIDPEGGRVVTANNRPVPDDWPDYFATDCHPTTRADRIVALLDGLKNAEPQDMAEIMRDTRSAPALAIAARLAAVRTEDPGAKRLQALLGPWDGRMDMGLVAPTAYTLVRQEMTRIFARRSGLDAIARDPIAAVAPGVPWLVQLWWALPNLLRDDDATLLGGAGWDEVMKEALETVGAGPAPAPWAVAHQPTFVHPLAALFPDRAAELAPRADPVSGDGDCVCAIGALATMGTPAVYGPVARYVFDLGDWDRSRWVVFHGASGHPGDPHYDDQNPLWARGALIPAPYSRAAVDAHTVARRTLTPGGSAPR